MLEQNFIFAIGTVSLSKCSGRKACSLSDAVRHNRRLIAAEVGVSSKSKINPARCHLNQTLCGPDALAGVLELAEQTRLAAGVFKVKKDYVQAVELLFSLPSDSLIADVTGYFKQCLKWAQKSIGLVILSADCHFDEPNPHCHVLLSPFVGGVSRAKELRSRQGINQLSESFFKSVAGPAGLRRQGAKMVGLVKQWAADAVVDRLRAIEAPEIAGALWPLTQDSIKKNPLPYLLALGIDPASLRAPNVRTIALVPQTERTIALGGTGVEFKLSGKNDPEKEQGLSSVALHQNLSPSNVPSTKHDRHEKARQAQQSAIDRTTNSNATVAQHDQVAQTFDDGFVRVRDADFDVDAWTGTWQ